MAFAAVSSLIETLEDLLRFTFLALEIESLQKAIAGKYTGENSIRDFVQSIAEDIFFNPWVLMKRSSLFDFILPQKDGSLLLHDDFPYFLKIRTKEISDLRLLNHGLLIFLKDLASIYHDCAKIKYLERSLTDLAYSIEDTIEEAVLDHSIISKAFNFITGVLYGDPTSIMEKAFRIEILDIRCGTHLDLQPALMEINLIKKEVENIYEEAPIVKVDMQLGQSSGIADSLQNMTTNKMELFEMDDGFVSVLDRVIRDSSPLDMVAIVGMGGIGKTTLARRIFEYRLTCHHFYIRAWVMVSQVYQVRDILKGILRSINHVTDEINKKETGQLAEELFRSLKGKRFLIVLDNIWSSKAWDDLKRFFPDDKNGSRIVLTTRLRKVADYVNRKQPPYCVKLLDIDQSWKLLQQKVFGEESCPVELEDIGRRIARKCQGLPLVIVVIAGILCKTTRTRDYWQGITESVSSVVSSDPEQCLEILALSYNHLPNHLKACFLYMGAFPQDCEIEAQKLIRLWIAEGLLDKKLSSPSEDVKRYLIGEGLLDRKSSEEVKRYLIAKRLLDKKSSSSSKNVKRYLLHDIDRFLLLSDKSISSLELEAETYLQDLIDRNLVLVGKRSFSGKIRKCHLHELLQDLCIREAAKEKFMHVIRQDFDTHSIGITDPRRLSLHSNFWGNLHSLPPMKLVRSFLCFTLGFDSIPDTLFFQLGFKLLRVLDIIFLSFQSFPFHILQLVHLRYLAFTATYELPVSISELRNLQTLIIHGPWIRDEYGDSPILLLEYWDMPWLRHLHTTVPCYLRNPFIAKKNLRCSLHPHYLESLSAIMFSSCSQEVFSLMPNLKKLGIFESEEDYRTDVSSKWLSNLVHLNRLEALKCSFYAHNRSPRNRIGLILPSSLKKLTLSWSYLPWVNMTPIAWLPNLEVLKLKNYAFQGPEWTPSEERFPCLKHLLIENLDLVHLEATRVQFPCLEHLALRSCKSLEEIPFDIAEIPTLQLIELHYCSESSENSAKEIQEQIDGVNVDIRNHRSQSDTPLHYRILH